MVKCSFFPTRRRPVQHTQRGSKDSRLIIFDLELRYDT